jgi:hypothetical protein
MSAWQVVFHIIPRRGLANQPQVLAPAALEETDWWASSSPPVDYMEQLSTVTGAAPTGTDARKSWGPQVGYRIEVRRDAGRVMGIKVFVDVRRLDSRFGAALLLFLRAADAVLIRRDGVVVPGRIDEFAKSLRSSAAWRHASDPMAFLAAREREEAEEND